MFSDSKECRANRERITACRLSPSDDDGRSSSRSCYSIDPPDAAAGPSAPYISQVPLIPEPAPAPTPDPLVGDGRVFSKSLLFSTTRERYKHAIYRTTPAMGEVADFVKLRLSSRRKRRKRWPMLVKRPALLRIRKFGRPCDSVRMAGGNRMPYASVNFDPNPMGNLSETS